MTSEEYIILYKRYLQGAATPNEIALLTRYKDGFDISKFDNDEPVSDQELIKDRIFQQVERRLSLARRRAAVRRLWWSAAASVLLLSGIGGYYFSGPNGSKVNVPPGQLAKTHHPIVPGTNKAILILGNGDKIDLEQVANGRIIQDGKVSINKLKNGQLQYKLTSTTGNNVNQIVYNTIITPRGGQYHIMLPDGTSVWLNSASSLRYPISFTGAERHVELNGEGYFEVAKSKHLPFTVAAGKMNVRVLGTHFNIAAYDDDQSAKTTLLEGSVSLTKNKQQVTLVPGQQAIAENNGSSIVTKTVNANDAIAWKNGFFSFRKETLENAMRKIARWYDVEVVYQGKKTDKLLGGSVLRTQSITEMLSYLETIGIAKFKIEGRRIMVKAN